MYLQKAPVKNIRRRQSKIEGPIWDVLNPSEITAPRRLSRPPKVNMLQQIFHQDFWLTSDFIDLASYIMAKDNVHIDGFQSALPFSAIANGGIVGTPQNKCVHILHIRQNHWITVSYLFCGENQLSVYDSKSAPLDQKTLQTLSWMVRPQSEHFYVLQPAVQQQSNLSNCGVFSVAFAYALCKGHPPELCMFNEGRLRSQLYASLTKNCISFSIKIRESEAQANVTKTAVPVYCVCRTAHYKELMVQCCSCQQWYHPTCVYIPKTVIGTDQVWQCVTCH